MKSTLIVMPYAVLFLAAIALHFECFRSFAVLFVASLTWQLARLAERYRR